MASIGLPTCSSTLSRSDCETVLPACLFSHSFNWSVLFSKLDRNSGFKIACIYDSLKTPVIPTKVQKDPDYDDNKNHIGCFLICTLSTLDETQEFLLKKKLSKSLYSVLINCEVPVGEILVEFPFRKFMERTEDDFLLNIKFSFAGICFAF